MKQAINLSKELIEEAKIAAKQYHRSIPKQIEHWSQIGKKNEADIERLAKIATICKDNPDFSYQFAEEVFDAIDDKGDPASWITIEELEKNLDI
jgi:hypothetical protein